MKRAYIAGPYSHGDAALNVRQAMIVADALISEGYAPYVPHLTHFLHMLFPRDNRTWRALDMEWVKVCDVLVRFPGLSEGADLEVAEAERLGIEVRFWPG